MSPADGQPGVPEVGPSEAAELIKSGAFLLDVRELDEWLAGRAELATHIPLGNLGDRIGEVPTDQKIVVVCRSGARSGRATEALVRHGYDAVNLAGGMQAWAADDRAVVTDDGSPGTVA